MRRPAAVTLSAALLIGGAAGHGAMTQPTSRNHGSIDKAGYNSGGYCNWGTWAEGCQGAVTIDLNLQPDFLTECCLGNDCGKRDALHCSWTKNGPIDAPPHVGCAPWRAPGTGRVNSPCGKNCDNTGNFWPDCTKLNGTMDPAVSALDGVDLPKTQLTEWTAGGTAAVAWATAANHGGGYAYRLCKASEKLTEECFQKTHLKFATDTTELVDSTNTVKYTIPAKTTSTGTVPAGSQWRMDPIPGGTCTPATAPDGDCSKHQPFTPPAPDAFGYIGENATKWNMRDMVQVPDLEAGEYVLSWRWDTEQAAQVYLNCADIKIVSGGPPPPPTPAPPSTPAPPKTPPPATQPPPPSKGWKEYQSISCFIGDAGKAVTTIVNTTVPACQESCSTQYAGQCDVISKMHTDPIDKFNCFLLTVPLGMSTCGHDAVFDSWAK